MADPVAAFQGWNSSLQGWNTGAWNTNVAYPVTATSSVGATTVSGDADVSVTGVAGTSAVGSASTSAGVTVSVTGVVGTSAVGSTTAAGGANVTVTGLSATGEIGILQQPWGLIIPSQTSNFSGISASQTPSWAEIAA